MSEIIPITPLNGVINKKESLSGVVNKKESLTGKMSVDIIKRSYNDLLDLPSLNDEIIKGDKDLSDYGFVPMTPQEIDNIIFGGE